MKSRKPRELGLARCKAVQDFCLKSIREHEISAILVNFEWRAEFSNSRGSEPSLRRRSYNDRFQKLNIQEPKHAAEMVEVSEFREWLVEE